MKVKNLKKTIASLNKELCELHLNEPSETYYKMRREDIEFAITALEDQLDFEKRMLPFKIALYGFVVVSLGLLVYALTAIPY